MMILLLILAAWLLLLVAFLVLKARQPKWEYPRPPMPATQLRVVREDDIA